MVLALFRSMSHELISFKSSFSTVMIVLFSLKIFSLEFSESNILKRKETYLQVIAGLGSLFLTCDVSIALKGHLRPLKSSYLKEVQGGFLCFLSLLCKTSIYLKFIVEECLGLKATRDMTWHGG